MLNRVSHQRKRSTSGGRPILRAQVRRDGSSLFRYDPQPARNRSEVRHHKRLTRERRRQHERQNGLGGGFSHIERREQRSSGRSGRQRFASISPPHLDIVAGTRAESSVRAQRARRHSDGIPSSPRTPPRLRCKNGAVSIKLGFTRTRGCSCIWRASVPPVATEPR